MRGTQQQREASEKGGSHNAPPGERNVQLLRGVQRTQYPCGVRALVLKAYQERVVNKKEISAKLFAKQWASKLGVEEDGLARCIRKWKVKKPTLQESIDFFQSLNRDTCKEGNPC
jgi:hypothetical protein